MKASILTLGCKTNQAESSLMEGNLKAHGYDIVELSDKPEICIINTCTVTSKSDYQSRQLIRRAQKAGSKVIVTGCYADLNANSVKVMEGVSKVVENKNKLGIIEVLTGASIDITLGISLGNKSRFFLKVQDGCNFACTYCLIPKARGKSISLRPEKIIKQAKIASECYNEIVLTGIHLGTYGYDLNPKLKLYNLVEGILRETSIKRIRLSSLEIREIDEGLLELLKDNRLCNHLHIPLQSGDEKILKLMNRNYNINEFLKGINNIYKRFPDIAIGTDIIAGFPGEGEDEFRNTLVFLESLPLSYIHVFPYSSRPSTPASEMPASIRSEIKNERCAILRGLGQRKKREYMMRQVGKTLELIIEGKPVENYFIGTTGNYLRLRAPKDNAMVKDVVSVRVDDVADDMLIGHVI